MLQPTAAPPQSLSFFWLIERLLMWLLIVPNLLYYHTCVVLLLFTRGFEAGGSVEPAAPRFDEMVTFLVVRARVGLGVHNE